VGVGGGGLGGRVPTANSIDRQREVILAYFCFTGTYDFKQLLLLNFNVLILVELFGHKNQRQKISYSGTFQQAGFKNTTYNV